MFITLLKTPHNNESWNLLKPLSSCASTCSASAHPSLDLHDKGAPDGWEDSGKDWNKRMNPAQQSMDCVLSVFTAQTNDAVKHWMFLLRSLADIFNQRKAFARVECSCVSQLNNCRDSVFSHLTVALHLWCAPQCQHREMEPDSSCSTSAGPELRPWCTALSTLQRKDSTRGKRRGRKKKNRTTVWLHDKRHLLVCSTLSPSRKQACFSTESIWRSVRECETNPDRSDNRAKKKKEISPDYKSSFCVAKRLVIPEIKHLPPF